MPPNQRPKGGQLNCEISADVLARFRQDCRTKGLKMRHVLETLIAQHLERSERKARSGGK